MLVGLLVLGAVLAGVGPGALVAARLRLSGVERVVIAPGLSVLVAYLGGLALFVAGRPELGGAWVAVLAVVGVFGVRHLVRWGRGRAGREVLGPAGVVAGFLMLALMSARMIGGGTWTGDWVEHLMRAEYFAGKLPDDYKFLSLYPVSSRPPLQNVVVALLLTSGGAKLATVQVGNWAFAGMALLPLMGLRRMFALRGGRLSVWPIVLLLCCSTALVGHTLFPWTRCLTAYFVLTSVWLYVRSLAGGRGAGVRMAVAFLMMGAAGLTHFSAGPYAVAMVAHAVMTRPRRAAGPLLWMFGGVATWFVVSTWRFGAGATFGSNTSVREWGSASTAGNLGKLAVNLGSSLLTLVATSTWGTFLHLCGQASRLGLERDYAFHVYACSLPGASGPWLGVPVMVALWRERCRGAAGRFWRMFVPTVIVVGIAVIGEREVLGGAQLCLFPLELMALAYLSARVERMGRTWRGVIVAGVVVDFLLGVLPHLLVLSTAVREGEAFPFSASQRDSWVSARIIGGRLVGDVVGGAARPVLLGGMVGVVLVAGWKVWRGGRVSSRAGRP